MIRSLKFKIGVLLLLISLSNCSKNDGGGSDAPNPIPTINLAEERKKIAQHLADHFIQPAFETLSQSMQNLQTAFEEFEASQTQQNLQTLQQRLRSSWLVWQRASIFQIGPAESNAIRLALNVYPTDVNQVENNIETQNYTLGTIENRDAVGFPALDFLINQSETPAVNLPFDEHRSQYMRDIITYGVEIALQVMNDFNTGSYLTTFVSDQSNGTDVGSALGQIVNAMDHHFQRYVRDGKLAIPAGIRSAGIPRPTTTEAFYGGYSVELLQESVQAYLDLFNGDGYDGVDGPSILSYLVAIDQQVLANDIRSQLELVINSIELLSDPLSQQLIESSEPAETVFIHMQDFITLLKSDMASVMGVTITNQDNDGD